MCFKAREELIARKLRGANERGVKEVIVMVIESGSCEKKIKINRQKVKWRRLEELRMKFERSDNNLSLEVNGGWGDRGGHRSEF